MSLARAVTTDIRARRRRRHRAKQGWQWTIRSTPAMRRYSAFAAMIWRSSPGWMLAAVGAAVLAGLLPAVMMIASGVLVGSLPGVVRAGFSSGSGRHAVAALVVFGLASVLFALAESAVSAAGAAVTAGYVVTMDDQLAAASLGPATIAHLEDPTVARQFAAAIEAGREGVNLTGPTDGLAVVQSRLTGLAAAAVLFAYRWWAPLVMAAGWIVFGVTLGRVVATVFDELIQVTGSDRRRAEYLRGVLVSKETAKEVRVFGLADWMVGRFADIWLSTMRLVWRHRQRASRPFVLGILAMVVANAVVISLLAHDAFTGVISTGRLVVFVQATLATVTLGLIGDQQWTVGRAAATAEHVNDLARRFGEGPAPLTKTVGRSARSAVSVELKQVRFTYPTRERPTLDRFDLRVPPGQLLAVVGENGAGKSTLIKLLLGLYQPETGEVIVDGINTGDGDLAALRRRVAVIFQDFLRYELSLRDNVGFGAVGLRPDVDRLGTALHVAGGDPVLGQLDAGWDTPLSAAYEGGTDLSGGQWQRVALARVLTRVMGGAGLLILDEPTAGLDVRAEIELFQQLPKMVSGVTTILVSHRLSSVRHADRIVVISEGRIAEDGTHEELLRANGSYARMFALQAQSFARTGVVDEPVRSGIVEGINDA